MIIVVVAAIVDCCQLVIIIAADRRHLYLSPSPKIIGPHHVIGVGTDLHLIFGSRSAVHFSAALA